MSVPTIERSEPFEDVLDDRVDLLGLASRNRSAAFRSDSTSRPILNVATPWTWTLMPWLVTASLELDRDLAGGELEPADPVADRDHEGSAADHDLHAADLRPTT